MRPDQLERLYRENAWDEIIESCIQKCKDTGFELPRGDPWFGPLCTWVDEFTECSIFTPSGCSSNKREKEYHKSISPIDKIQKNIPAIASELGGLLPRKRYVKTFLPVLIWAYCINWKKPRRDSDSDHSPFIEQLLCSNEEEELDKKIFEKYKNQFLVLNPINK